MDGKTIRYADREREREGERDEIRFDQVKVGLGPLDWI